MHSLRCPWLLGIGAALALVPAAATAQVPDGAEFQVNTYTLGEQFAGMAAGSSFGGNFVAVWQSFFQDGDGFGVVGRRFTSFGTPSGSEFQVNTYTTGYQTLPWAAFDGKGRFVVVWNSFGPVSNPFPSSVRAQRFAANGTRLGSEFVVNTSPAEAYWGRVSVNRAGDFVIVWLAYGGPGTVSIQGQRFDRTGRRLGGEFQVNQATTGYQVFPDVKMANTGGFVVVWSGPEGGPGNYGVLGRRFAPDGQPTGPEFRVNTYTTGYQVYASVHGPRTGNPTLPFVVAWQSQGQDGSAYGVFARRFDGNGNGLGAEFQVNTYTTGNQSGRPVAIMDEGGNFAVSWRSTAPQDGSAETALARRFFVNGTPRSPEFVLNTYTTGAQDSAHLGTDPFGNFIAVWRSSGQDGSLSGVFGRRFGGLRPSAVIVDPLPGPTQDGNGVWQPGETVDIRPSWTNNSTAAVSGVAGLLANMSGPAGCVQAITDGVALYGVLPAGMATTCGDCYGVAATQTTPRCVQHWDVRTIETLAPDAQGQSKEWLLHVGDSFTDVPDTNPFYRFIETVFHHGITTGCGGTNYCPGDPTARDQMAVFMLLGLEGTGYRPAPCGTPVFSDVPASSPFCPYVEEMARRGVVAGCGSGNYCPSSPVTREQMAVFLLRTRDPASNPPPCVPGMEIFADVPASSPFCRWIEEIARNGIAAGCGFGNYCPTLPITREQMAVFVVATFGLKLYE